MSDATGSVPSPRQGSADPTPEERLAALRGQPKVAAALDDYAVARRPLLRGAWTAECTRDVHAFEAVLLAVVSAMMEADCG
jgi:hypothetical protein